MQAAPAAASRDGGVDARQPGEAAAGRGERACSPLAAGGIWQSAFALVQTALGSGVLTIPYVLRLSGCAVGTGLVFFCGLVALAGMRILMSSAVDLQVFTFSGLLSSCLGARSGMLLDVSLFFYGTGACVTYFIFLGDFIPDLVLYFGGCLGAFDQADGAPSADDIRTRCLVGSLVMVIPLCLPRELSALRHVSPIALAGILYTATVVFGKMCWRVYSQDSEFDHAEIEFKAEELTELINPGNMRIGMVTMRVVVVELVIYMLLSWGGYMSFGRETPANIIAAYDKHDPWITMSRVMLAMAIGAAIPANVNPTVRSLLNLLEACIPSLRQEVPTAPGAQGRLQPLLSGSPVTPPEGRPPPRLREVVRKLLAVCSCVFQCWVAVSVKNVASVIQVLGATVGTLMMMVVPVLLVHRACPDLYGAAPKWGCTLLLGLATALSVASLVLS